MIKSRYTYFFFYFLFFSLTILILYLFNSVKYYENSVTDVIDLASPFLKNNSFYNDLTISLIFFLFFFYFIDKYSENYLSLHFKIIWTFKNFFSFFLIQIYENYAGLDQVHYFYIVSNNIQWHYHFGNLNKLIDFNNSTINFLFFIKIINFIFNNSWFMQKLFQNLLYIGSIIFIYKTIADKNFRLKNNILILYLLAFLPSIFFFSSLITKDFLILFSLSIIFYTFLCYDNLNKKKIFIIISILSLICIFLLRWWVAFAIIISFLIYFVLLIIDKFICKSKYLIFITLSSFAILFFLYSTFYSEISINIYTFIFERIKVEHLYNPNFYNVLFINAGTKYEVLNLYPLALFKTLFNPFIDDIFSFKKIIFSIENLFIFIFLLLSIKNLKKNFFDKLIVLISFLIIICHVYLPIGYLNSGTTLRYALQAKLALMIILFILNKDFFNNANKKFLIFLFKIYKNKIKGKRKSYSK